MDTKYNILLIRLQYDTINIESEETHMAPDEPIIKYTTMADSVYLWIKNAIIQGEFKPGEHLTQETLTRKLGVSRTPIRDAIKRLEAEGLLIAKPRCGAVVFSMTLDNLRELYEVRTLLEQYCAVKTCHNASDEEIKLIEQANFNMYKSIDSLKDFMHYDRAFHYLLCKFSKCTNTVEMLESFWNKCDSFKSIYYSLDGRCTDTLQEHAAMVQAIKDKDKETLKIKIAAHLLDVVNTVKSKVNFS